ncbi:MAG: sensor histidine kinase [Haloarculaceae archaeon]
MGRLVFDSETGYLRRVPANIIGGIGVVLLGLAGWHVLSTHLWVMLAETDPARFALEFVEAVMLVVPPILVVAVGYRAATSEGSRPHQRLLLRWHLVGLASVVGIIVSLSLHRILLGVGIDVTILEMELLTGAGVGSLLGLAVGLTRARSERQATRIERQRDGFLLLHRLLRHRILNGVQIIDGRVARFDDRDDPELRRLLTAISAQTRELSSFVGNVRGIVRAFTDDLPSETRDLDAIVASSCAEVARVRDSATFETDLAAAVAVDATEALSFALRTLLENAARYSNQKTPIRVSVEDRDRTARLSITDTGPAIAASDPDRSWNVDDLDEREIGVYLATHVVSQHGGRLSVAASGDDETTVVIDLPKATT